MRDEAKLMEALRWIADREADGELRPTVREVQEGLRLSSTSVAVYRLSELRRRGWLGMDGTKARSMRLTAEGRRVLGLGAEEKRWTRSELMAAANHAVGEDAVVLQDWLGALLDWLEAQRRLQE